MGIIETLDECINKYLRSSDESIRKKGILLSNESKEIKAIVYGLIKYQKDRKQIISENDKNNKTEHEIENIYNKISFILNDTLIDAFSTYGCFISYSTFKEIESEMKYYRNEVTHNNVFNLDTILAVKKVVDIEYKFENCSDNIPHQFAEMFPANRVFISDAADKFNECIRNDKKIAEEVTANREHCELIERFLRKIVYQLSFIDIIENKDLILLFKKVLKENFDYIIEHTNTSK